MKKHKALFFYMGICALLLVFAVAFTAPLLQPAYAPVAPGPFFAENGGLVNINTAPVAELAALPGIGDTLAQRIVAYRQQNGVFRSAEELANVQGISAGMAEDLAEKICVEE